MKKIAIPKEVVDIVHALESAGFEAYPVGGCVRDVLLGIEPRDWDVTTNAKPEEIRALFQKTFYENKFYTVTIQTDSNHNALKEIEITTFRSEGRYEDKRRPSDIKPAKNIEEDLSRRDFTINAIALNKTKEECPSLVDPFGGKDDLEAKLLRAVGNADERFNEDALRMLRAVRIAITLKFEIEKETASAIMRYAQLLKLISKERIRDEFMKIISSDYAQKGVELLHTLGLLKHFFPEIEEGIGVGQNKHHIYTVWEHNLRALNYAAKEKYEPLIRLAALFHDIAKPRSKRGDGYDSTFYGHDVLGAKMTIEVMERLKFSRSEIEKVSKLVRWHLFNYDIDTDDATTDSSIRRLIRNIGEENIADLVRVRICDRIGSGVPKAIPYRLRHFQYRVEKVIREKEAVRVTMLKINGEDIIKILNIPPGPKIGHILNALLEEALDDSSKNTSEYLLMRVPELGKLSEKELIGLREKAEEKVEFVEGERQEGIKKKFHIR